MDDTFWWLPPNYSEEGDRIDEVWNLVTWIVVAIFVLVQGAIVWAMLRYRSRPGRRARYLPGSRRLELLWTLIPAAILAYVMVVSQDVWAALREERPADEEFAARVWIDAQRFAWNVHYPGADGEFGTVDDFDAPLNVVVLPEGAPVLVQITSQDVIHSFFVPYLRLKVDAVPGLTTELWWTARSPGPDADGDYRSFERAMHILCAELCGDLHYNMKGFLWVVPPEEYAAWVASRTVEDEMWVRKQERAREEAENARDDGDGGGDDR